MRASFQAHGFDDESTEYLVLDNSASNTADAYRAINLFLQGAAAPHIILCHQDVELVDDGYPELMCQIAAMEACDPTWAVLGNAGSSLDGRRVVRISDPGGTNRRSLGLPVQVSALDENFLFVRASANLAVSRDLEGFHHYAHDLCIVADVLGWTCYVIDFHLLHKSIGSINAGFHASRVAIAAKYARAFKARWIAGTTQAPYLIGGSMLDRRISWLVLAGRRLSYRAARRFGLPWADKDAMG